MLADVYRGEDQDRGTMHHFMHARRMSYRHNRQFHLRPPWPHDCPEVSLNPDQQFETCIELYRVQVP